MARAAFALVCLAGLAVATSVGADGMGGEHSPYLIYPANRFEGRGLGGAPAVIDSMEQALSRGGVTMTRRRLIREQTFAANLEGPGERLGLSRGVWVSCRAMLDVLRGQQIGRSTRTEIISSYITAVSCRRVKGGRPSGPEMYGSNYLKSEDIDVVLVNMANIVVKYGGDVRQDYRLPNSFAFSAT